MRHEEQINPAILVWARESAGLALKDAAQKLALNETKELSAEQRLIELERGTRFPTRAQLSKFAKTYRRPLVAFYMATPPKKSPRGEDFRFTDTEISLRENALLDALVRDVKARQEMVRDLLEDIDEASTKEFVSSSGLRDGVGTVAKRISSSLDIPSQRSAWGRNSDEFFKRLRTETERLGIFVLLAGDLGSYRSTLSEDVFRGFALADQVAPFIVINDHDARTARSFTLIHELVHIYLGKSGVSGSPDSVKEETEEGRVERFCNEVSSLVLLPEDFELRKPSELSSGNKKNAENYIQDIAHRWIVSEPMVAFRLRRLGWIPSGLYRDLCASYADRWSRIKENTKTQSQLKEGGPDYYVLKQSRLGDALVGVVRRTLRESRLTHTKAAKVLGVKATSVEPLLRRYEKSYAYLSNEVTG